MRPADERYFDRLEAELEDAFAVAERARARGNDPKGEVEIPVAKDMADRVENILGIDGVAERVRELEGRMSREEAALALVEDFVEGTVGDYDTRAGKVEGAVRTAVALLTEGVVAAPIEGIDSAEVLANDDGTAFINVYYAGPIRSAGGTAQALSVLVADYARTLLDIEEFKPRSDEVARYAEEVALYDKETGLQYTPEEAETAFIAEHMPIMLDGEATSDEEVSGHRDLERVDTNGARGGMCLVLAEGIALKAPKIQRYTSDLDDVDWPWLQDLIDGTYDAESAETDPLTGADADGEGMATSKAGTEEAAVTGETEAVPDDSAAVDEQRDGSGGAEEAQEAQEAQETEKADEGENGCTGRADGAAAGPPRMGTSKKYLRDLIAGRPVFSHPSEPGGFRLRYGRARNHGFATAGVHPATMHLVDDFLATGTQIKTENPGKAAGVVPVDSIEGPTVRLANGDVLRIDDPAEALEIRNGVEKVLDLGEYLVNYGEFVENNMELAPASYTVEWWRQEFADAGGPVRALADAGTDLAAPEPGTALEWATEYDAPLHPAYTYCWHDLTVEETLALADAVAAGEVAVRDGSSALEPGASPDPDGDGLDDPSPADGVLVLPRTGTVRRALERLLLEHSQEDDRLVVPIWRPLVRSLGFDEGLERNWERADVPATAMGYADGENAIELVRHVAPFALRERAPTRIGNRMGRPEKSEERELSPAVHTLFPIGEAGGNERKVGEAAEAGDEIEGTKGEVRLEMGRRECEDCGTETFEPGCPACGGVTSVVHQCPDCGYRVDPDGAGRTECPRCEIGATPTQQVTVDVGDELEDALAAVGARPGDYEVLKGVKGLSSAHKTPEPMEKGILRAKHGVSVFKDGTVRYDMTDLPVTAVRPAELDVPVEQFRDLGYETDIHGEALAHDDQLLELKVQDVVLSNGAAEHMLATADFVDELLDSYYGLDPYYDVEARDDLVGELVFGMAPHTSAAVVGRVVGFTSAAVGYAHPYFHASKRRNCDGDEDCVMLLLDGLLNFSREYLPAQRGGRMDAPLVMSSRIDPTEIDDEAHNVDIMETYPREFYEATRELADPDTVADRMRIAEDTLGTEDQYSGFAHTHDTTNIAGGPDLSAYKTLGSMEDKMNAQLALARKIRAVDQSDVAERIIEYHFLPDLIGNLRAFSRQEVRCVDCGYKYRRMPLTGICRMETDGGGQCGGDVNLTVHEGSVTKYLETAMRVAEEFGAREYTKQRLDILERRIDRIFENDENKQSGIADFM